MQKLIQDSPNERKTKEWICQKRQEKNIREVLQQCLGHKQKLLVYTNIPTPSTRTKKEGRFQLNCVIIC